MRARACGSIFQCSGAHLAMLPQIGVGVLLCGFQCSEGRRNMGSAKMCDLMIQRGAKNVNMENIVHCGNMSLLARFLPMYNTCEGECKSEYRCAFWRDIWPEHKKRYYDSIICLGDGNFADLFRLYVNCQR